MNFYFVRKEGGKHQRFLKTDPEWFFFFLVDVLLNFGGSRSHIKSPVACLTIDKIEQKENMYMLDRLHSLTKGLRNIPRQRKWWELRGSSRELNKTCFWSRTLHLLQPQIQLSIILLLLIFSRFIMTAY